MSVDNLTQILGIIGTITGALALLISYWIYTSAKPKLKVTVKKCEHYYDELVEENSKIRIYLQLSISNCGDRATTLNEISVQFMHDGKEYKFKKEIEREVTDDDNEILGVTKVSVPPHETINEFLSFDGFIKGIQQEEIDCKFKIFHTHGAYSFKATSKLG